MSGDDLWLPPPPDQDPRWVPQQDSGSGTGGGSAVPSAPLPLVSVPWTPAEPEVAAMPAQGAPFAGAAESGQAGRPGLGMGRPLRAPASQGGGRSRRRGGRSRTAVTIGVIAVALLGAGGTALAVQGAGGRGSSHRAARHASSTPIAQAAAAAATPDAAAAPPAPSPSPHGNKAAEGRKGAAHRKGQVAAPGAGPAPAHRKSSRPSAHRTSKPKPKPKPKPKKTQKKCPIYDNGVLLGWTPC